MTTALMARGGFLLSAACAGLLLLTACAGLLLLTACAVGPDFKTPAAPDVKTYGATQPLQTSAAEGEHGEVQKFVPGADIPAEWWTVFHSEPLNKLVEQAIKGNPDIAAAQASLREAQENTAAASGYLFPAVTGDWNSVRQQTVGAQAGGSFPGSLYTLHTATLNLSYGLDIWGGTRRAIEQYGALEDFQRFQLEAAYLTLTSNVVTAAITEASLRGQIAMTQQIVGYEEKQLDVLQQQLDLGAIDRSAVLSQRTAVEQVRATLPGLEKQLSQTRHQISVLLGKFPNEPPGATFELSQLALPQEVPLSVPSKLAERRPDVQAAEASLHAASAGIGIAEAARLPQITLSADVGSQANAIDNLFSHGSWIWAFGGDAAQTIFDAGSLAHKQGAAEAEFERTAAEYRKTVLAAFLQVADTLRAIETDAAALKAQAAATSAADENLGLSQIQYDAGSISYLNLLITQQQAQQAKLALVQAEAQRFIDTAALFQALGGGWWNRKEDISKPSGNGD